MFGFIRIPPEISEGLLSLACAELFLVIARSREITILFKAAGQRTDAERLFVRRGLSRALLLEAVLFLPASVFLVLVIFGPLLIRVPVISALSKCGLSHAYSGMLGLLSYQFPFATVRRIITRIALHTLQSFAAIVVKSDEDSLKTTDMVEREPWNRNS